MSQHRKHAYRYLLYYAMLDIRSLAWSWPRGWRLWNPLFWRREAGRVRQASALADWLHNLALFSALDFEHFDEDRFWADFRHFHERYPEFGLARYEKLFNDRLAVRDTARDNE